MYSLVMQVLLFASALAVAVPPTYTVHEKRGALHPRWSKGARVEAHKILPMRIGLAQNLEGAEEHLLDVSDPTSPNFAKYWSPEKVVQKFQPSVDTVEKVRSWLTEAGIHPYRITHSDNKGWLAFYATTAEAEQLLLTAFHEFHDSISDGIVPACDGYHLPEDLRSHIDYVSPGIKLLAPNAFGTAPKLKRRSLSSTELEPRSDSTLPPELQHCDEIITPACVAALYNIPLTDKSLTPLANNSLGIYESEADWYYDGDLKKFFNRFAPYIPQDTIPKYISIDGAPGPLVKSNASESSVEAMLDLGMAYPIVYPQTITIFQEDDAHYENLLNDTYTFGFNTWLDAIDGSYCTFAAYGEKGDSNIDPQYPDPSPGGYKGKLQCGLYQTTNLVSVSYGGQEADVPAAYQKRQCLEYLKLGLQGVSLLFSSGDAGVGNHPAPYGDDNPDTGCIGPNGLLFNPTWPNNCPYVTNVGATQVYPGKTVFEPESAASDLSDADQPWNFSSGGGFSNLYAIPKYQQQAIASYFQNNDPPYKSYSKLVNKTSDIPGLGKDGGLYNRIGRGIPDVAANGDNLPLYINGDFRLASGTSASTPIFASIINRINEERLRQGKTSVGFLNPVLYQHPEILNDITNGTNPGCTTSGFSAAKGWDPVTGLGTPNFPKMLALFLSLP